MKRRKDVKDREGRTWIIDYVKIDVKNLRGERLNEGK